MKERRPLNEIFGTSSNNAAASKSRRPLNEIFEIPAIPAQDDISKAESLARGAAQGVSFGFADELTGGLEALGSIYDKGDMLENAKKAYDESVKLSRENYKAAEEANPTTYMTGDIVGSLATPGGALKSAKTISQLAKIGTGVGLAQGAGRSEGETPIEIIGDAYTSGAIGGVASPVVGKTAEAIGKGASKVLSNVKGKINPEAPAETAVSGALTSEEKLIKNALNAKGSESEGLLSDTIQLLFPERKKSTNISEDILNSLRGSSDDVIKSFTQNIKNGLSPEHAVIKAQADKMGVRLSLGDLTQDVIRQGEEDLALKGVYGTDAQLIAQNFRDQQRGDLANLAKNVSSKIGGKEVDEIPYEADVAQRLSDRLKQSANQEKQKASEAYDVAKNMESYLPKESLSNLSSSLRKTLDDEQFDIDAMPSVKKRLSEFEQITKKSKDADQLDIPFYQLENFRKRIINSPTSNPQEQTALTIMKKTYDKYIDDIIDQNLLKGDEKALNQIKNARGLWKEYKQKYYGKDGKALAGKIVDNDFTPEQTMNLVIGTSNVGAKKEAATAIRGLKNILGEQSPEFKQLKQVQFMRLFGNDLESILDGDLTKPINGVRFANNVDKFLKNNRTLANELLTKEELDLIKLSAKIAAQATSRKPGSVNTSGTTPTALRFLRQVIDRFVPGGQYVTSTTESVAKAGQNIRKQKELQKSFESDIGFFNQKEKPLSFVPENTFAKAIGAKLSSPDEENDDQYNY